MTILSSQSDVDEGAKIFRAADFSNKQHTLAQVVVCKGESGTLHVSEGQTENIPDLVLGNGFFACWTDLDRKIRSDDHCLAYTWSHPLDYLRMTFGINSDALDLYRFYQKMNNWYLADSYTFYNDSRSVIRFNALVFPFAFGRYLVHMIFMCFLSLCGLVALFKAFMPFFKPRLASLAIAIFLVPSVLFWGSGVLKEGLILFASGYLIYYFFKWLKEDNKLQPGFFFVLFIGLMMLIQVHILISLIPGFCIVWCSHRTC